MTVTLSCWVTYWFLLESYERFAVHTYTMPGRRINYCSVTLSSIYRFTLCSPCEDVSVRGRRSHRCVVE